VKGLLAKHGLLESVARRQQTPRSGLLEEMQRRQNLVELEMRLRTFHPADIASILESIPPDDRILAGVRSSRPSPVRRWSKSASKFVRR
jgi:magnesium transporter